MRKTESAKVSPRNGAICPEAVERFRAFTMAHPRLLQAKEELLTAIEASPPGSLILVLGPTGVGKTTLRRKVEETLIEAMRPCLQADPGRIAVLTIEAVAPEAGNFHWRDHFHRMLLAIREPLIDCKTDASPDGALRAVNGRYTGCPRDFTAYQFQQSFENAVRNRRPAAMIVDEAQHLARIASGRRLSDQLDVVKSVTDLFAAAQGSDPYLSLDVFRRNLDMCIERVSDGNISRFCRTTGLSFDTVVDWRSGTVHVRLDLLLKLCRALGFTPKTVLTANLEDSDVDGASAFTLTKTTPVRRHRSPAQINDLLTQALHAEPPISLRELATRLGYAAIQGLTRRLPEICASLRKKYNAANRRKLAKPFAHAPSDKVIRQAIEAALAARPRTTLRKVTQTLGFRNEVSLYNRFPELCRAFAAANRKDRAERLAVMRAECIAALQQGTPPSIREIAARVDCSEQAFSYRFPDLYAGLVQAAPERKRLLREQVRWQISVALYEDPAPSLDSVARRVGKNATQLLAQHPDVAREIRSRHNARQQAEAARRHARYREQIRTAADDLSLRGLSLSRKKIMAAIPSPVMNHCHIVDDELADIRRQLRGDQV